MAEFMTRCAWFAPAWALLLAVGTAPAATWYLSPTGSDSYSGTTTNAPLATVMAAQAKAASGDTVYILAGTYNLATNVYNSVQDNVYAVVNLINKNGITYAAMAGTRPVFNFSGVNPTGDRVAAFWVTASGVTFQGFDVVGVQENITTGNNQSIGFAIWGGGSCTWNEVRVHDGDCVGFYLEEKSANNLFDRCDSYNNAGINSYSYGNADGFGCHPAAGGTGNIYRECRSWNNSDDGYDCINAFETVTFDHCWSYLNGNNGGNGNGFKVGGWGSQPQNGIPNPIPPHVVFNCLSAGNSANGFYANHQCAGPGLPTGWTNNTAYANNTGYNLLQRNPPNYATNADQTDANDIAGTNEVMHNNLVFADAYADIQNLNEAGSLVSSNSWTETGVTVGAGDFQSTAMSQITNARAVDGSLPVITFMHLVSGDHLTGLGCFVVPPAPATLTATATNTQAGLTWTAATGATGYNLKRSSTSDGPYTTVVSNTPATNYTDLNLSPGATFYYVVTALNPGDESASSVPASVTLAPAAPAGLTATGGYAQVSLNWTSSVGATGYSIERSVASGGPYTTNTIPVTTNYVDAGLSVSTSYYYLVLAVNAGGQSPVSGPVSARTLTPAPPSFSLVTVAGTNLILSGAGGATTGIYYVLSTSNLTLPQSQWLRLATNHFDATGRFSLTNAMSAPLPPWFFQLQLP